MKLVSHRVVGAVYGLIILFCTTFLVMQAVRHSPWYKQRMYQRLLTGNEDQQLYAASALAQLGAENQLLKALNAHDRQARTMAQRGLEYLWFHAAGPQAYRLLKTAYAAAEAQDYAQALSVLDELTTKYPRFAEGWNRRGAVYWEIGEYAKSQANCERALALNPHHYGAWQGIGLCQLQRGDVAAACKSLRAALKILPHDDATRQSLERCEALLRPTPGNSQTRSEGDLI